MSDDIARLEDEPCPTCGGVVNHIEERNGYQLFVAPADGKLSLTAVTEWDNSGHPIGYGPTIRVSEGDKVVMGFVTDDE